MYINTLVMKRLIALFRLWQHECKNPTHCCTTIKAPYKFLGITFWRIEKISCSCGIIWYNRESKIIDYGQDC